MNRLLVEMLRVSDRFEMQYAAQRIEELEKENAALKAELQVKGETHEARRA